MECLERDFGDTSFVLELREIKAQSSAPSKAKRDEDLEDQLVVTLDKLLEWVEGINGIFQHYKTHPICAPPGYKASGPLMVVNRLVARHIHFQKEFTSHARTIGGQLKNRSVRSRCPALDKAWLERHPGDAEDAQEDTVRTVIEPDKWSMRSLWDTLKRAETEDSRDKKQRKQSSQSGEA